MRLLVGTRIYQALNSIRRATTPPVAKKRTPKMSIKTADVVAAPAASNTLLPKRRSKLAPAANVAAATATSETSTSNSRSEQLQQLWELNKETQGVVELLTKKEVQKLKDGRVTGLNSRAWTTVKRFSDSLEFASIEKLLMVDPRFTFEEGKIPDMKFVSELLWAAVLAKSLGSLTPSILNWIDEAVRRLPEPLPKQKNLMIWLLSIIRGDLPMLLRLQQESSRNGGRIGPEIERYKTLKHAALAHLDAGNREEFRSLWTSSGTLEEERRRRILAEEEQSDEQPSSALLHHALLRCSSSGKREPAMLRWYAESLVSYQRTPIPAEPQFETMMAPVIRAFGGKMEKWTEGDARIKKLRKWRDDYDDTELDKLVHSMLNHMNSEIVDKECWARDNMRRLGATLDRLNTEERRETTVVVDGLNYNRRVTQHLLPTCTLVAVRRDTLSKKWLPDVNERITALTLTPMRERTQGLDLFCALLAVFTRGHLLTNDKTREYVHYFRDYLRKQSRDVTQATLLKNYLNDAVLRHVYHTGHIEPLADHSKAAQWIDKEKKELAFTVARKIWNSSFRDIEYYSLHID